MVQEPLSNAAEHAPDAPCLVALDDSAPEELVVTATDDDTGPEDVTGAPVPDGAGSSGGFGLLGMHERAGLVDAHLEHGPTPEGGWRVQLRIPRDLTGARPSASQEETAR